MSLRPRIARVALAAACLASLTGAAKVKMDPANPTCPANPGWSANPTMTFTPATKGGAKVLEWFECEIVDSARSSVGPLAIALSLSAYLGSVA